MLEGSPLEPAVAATGPTYEPPDADERQSRLSRLYRLAEYHRMRNRKVVVVQGLGSLGVSCCAAAAGARRDDGEPRYFVVGLDLPRAVSYWKVARLNEGDCPYPELGLAAPIRQAALVDRNLVATIEDSVLGIADYVVVAVGDASREPLTPLAVHALEPWHPRVEGLGAAIGAVGARVATDALALIARPISRERAVEAIRVVSEGFRRRGLGSSPRIAWLSSAPQVAGSGESPPLPVVQAVDAEAAVAARSFLASLGANYLSPR